MDKLLKLEDLTFIYIIKLIDKYRDNKYFIEFLHNKNLPFLICDRLFNGLNGYYVGIHDYVINIFDNINNMELRYIRIGDENLTNKNLLINFIKNHKLKSLIIEYLELITIEELLENINYDELNILSLHRCKFLTKNKLCKEIKYNSNNKSKFQFLINYLPLINLTSLNLANTNTNDVQFFYLTKQIYQLEDVNISDTCITDIRLLKKQFNLKYLDCSELAIDSWKTYIHLHCLNNLKRLRFGNSINRLNKSIYWSNYVNPLIKYFLNDDELKYYNSLPERFQKINNDIYYNMTEFFDLSNWKQLTFIDILGYHVVDKKSVCNFIIRHRKLEYFGLCSNYPKVLGINRLGDKDLNQLFDIVQFEKVFGRNEMSFKILHTNYSNVSFDDDSSFGDGNGNDNFNDDSEVDDVYEIDGVNLNSDYSDENESNESGNELVNEEESEANRNIDSILKSRKTLRYKRSKFEEEEKRLTRYHTELSRVRENLL